MSLANLIVISEAKKPGFGELCNNCGWCCQTEVCQTGQIQGAGEMLTCKFLRTYADGRFCSLVIDKLATEEMIGAGTGCCAMTQSERIHATLIEATK